MRVLAADDDPVQLEAMRVWLQQLPASVTSVDNGTDAWDLLSRETFDLAIVDIHMPKLDGFGLIHWLRQTPRTVDLPIIVVTSRTDGEAIEQAYAAGATDFVTKPVNWQLFNHQAKFVMRSGAVEREKRAATLASAISERERVGVLKLIGDALDTALGDSDAVAALAQDLRWFTQALSGGIRSGIADCDRLIAQAAVSAEMLARRRGVSVKARQSLEKISILWDGELLGQALQRIVQHMVAHSAAGGVVELSAIKDEQGSLRITVRGGGGEVLKPALAMELAEKIIVAHGGEILSHHVPKEGAAVVLSLPQHAIEAASRREAS